MDADKNMIPAWVDGQLQPVEKLAVHQRGLSHRAVSVFVIGPRGVLLQQRALGKYHTPGLWANTCCTHPHWGEPAADCAARRLAEELGLEGLALEWREQVSYRADVGGGLIEDEVVEIFRATVTGEVDVVANPAEVMAVDWMTLPALERALAATPERFTPWLRIYMADHHAAIFGA